jgi:hypothetical protein
MEATQSKTKDVSERALDEAACHASELQIAAALGMGSHF